jgi:hypothetical protein
LPFYVPYFLKAAKRPAGALAAFIEKREHKTKTCSVVLDWLQIKN